MLWGGGADPSVGRTFWKGKGVTRRYTPVERRKATIHKEARDPQEGNWGRQDDDSPIGASELQVSFSGTEHFFSYVNFCYIYRQCS